ncbi:MAG: hypothetical protein LBK63_02855 [Treponema sp.]|jgi:hypothetical protein|nr:hypothetical protein [Treponema sp.]
MKKSGLLTAGMTILAVLIFAGCVGVTALGVLDESAPQEFQCPLEIRNNLSVIVYDGRPVEWAPEGLTNSRVTITLPPGEHTFVTKYTVSNNSANMTTINTVTDTLTQTFLAGHSYRIYRQDIWLLFFTISNVKIKDVTPKEQRT